MIEYPSIINSSKAPRQPCIAFEKYDGSNIRVKYTQKQGFCLFGSRTQLIDQSHPHLGKVVPIFNEQFREPLTRYFKREYPNEREAIVFGEFFGDKSFAGLHDPSDETFRFILFDVLVGHKNRKFIEPRTFVREFSELVPSARVIYEGNLNDSFIQEVRDNKFNLNEGVICKGTMRTGAARGGIWMCKIKTQDYINRLKARGFDLDKYGE